MQSYKICMRVLGIVYVQYVMTSHWGFPVLCNFTGNPIDDYCYIFYPPIGKHLLSCEYIVNACHGR